MRLRIALVVGLLLFMALQSTPVIAQACICDNLIWVEIECHSDGCYQQGTIRGCQEPGNNCQACQPGSGWWQCCLNSGSTAISTGVCQIASKRQAPRFSRLEKARLEASVLIPTCSGSYILPVLLPRTKAVVQEGARR